MDAALFIALTSLAIWLYLLIARGDYWKIHLLEANTISGNWPEVAVIIPARNEADTLPRSLPALVNHDYPNLRIILVDDGSEDATAEVAMRIAQQAGGRLTLVSGVARQGWKGKVAAMQSGIDHLKTGTPPRYVLFTDADIAYSPGVLKDLAAHAESTGSVLTSLMVKLRCESFAEHWLIPAFVYFFEMLYPFSRVNNPADKTAAAAGGCMLVRYDALMQAGGLEPISGALIDDCALGQLMKKQGPVSLHLTDKVHSIRPYPHAGDIRAMVARTAYDQLGYSPVNLAATLIGLLLVYLAPVLLTFFGSDGASLLGLASWGIMSITFLPIIRFYGRPLWSAPFLPVIALCYMHFTFYSARQYRRGMGGLWKGRAQAASTDGPAIAPIIFEPGNKTHKDENFPVASYIIGKQHRPAILAFYRFARAADDIADHPDLPEQQKIARLDEFEATLLGKYDVVPEALPLRKVLAARNLSPRHALDLLVAFRQDARKSRYKDWAELMDYCAYSAAPVGRFVLDVHGEDISCWPASDALCSALQIINHLQDCKADYQRLNRVYIPEDELAAYTTTVAALAQPRSSPRLQACIRELAQRTRDELLATKLSPLVKDSRLRLEVLTIEKLAHRLTGLLLDRDPLSQRVHLNKLQVIPIVMSATLTTYVHGRFAGRKAA